MTIYQAIALGSAALAVAAGLWDAYRLRHGQRYSGLVLAIMAGGPALSLWLYMMVTHLSLKPVASIVLVAVGAAIGVFLARRASTAVETLSDGVVRLRGASWLAVPSAAAVAALQLAAAMESPSWIVISLAVLEAAVAFGVAAAATLMYRRATLGQGVGAAAAPPTTPVPPAASGSGV